MIPSYPKMRIPQSAERRQLRAVQFFNDIHFEYILRTRTTQSFILEIKNIVHLVEFKTAYTAMLARQNISFSFVNTLCLSALSFQDICNLADKWDVLLVELKKSTDQFFNREQIKALMKKCRLVLIAEETKYNPLVREITDLFDFIGYMGIHHADGHSKISILPLT